MPIKLHVRRDDASGPPRTVQGNGRQSLMLAKLLPGDVPSVQFQFSTNDFFVLEFFQIDAYYSLTGAPAQLASADP